MASKDPSTKRSARVAELIADEKRREEEKRAVKALAEIMGGMVNLGGAG